jgi:hypothetical protein
MNTSGGRTEAANDRIRLDNNNNVTWSAVHSASGKCIIADDGYGSGGGTTGHDPTWDDINNIKARIVNGVVAITQKSPKTDWGPIITSSKSSLASSKCNCGVTLGKPTYSLSVTAGANGKVTKSPDAASFDSGAAVTLTAVANSGYKLKGWSGDATGANATVIVTMTSNKTISAEFIDANAKTTGNDLVFTNLVKNGDFSDGTNNWTFGAYNNATGTGSVAEGLYKVAVQTAGTENWHLQLLQGGISLAQNEKYVLSFSASSQSNTSIVANVGMGADPYTSYSTERTMSLTPTKTTYKFEFTMKEASTTNARVEFDCGKANSGWQIDDVSLTVAIEIGTIDRYPVFRETYASSIAGDQRISITRYDHTGRVLQHSSGDYATLMRLMRQRRVPGHLGSYIEVMQVRGRKLVKKVIAIGK